MVSYDKALEQSIEYFGGNELAAKVFVDKYALRDSDKKLHEETPNDMFIRIAKELARIERKKFKKPLSFDDIYSYLDHFRHIIPQGSLLYGIGNSYQYVTLSNCYVLGSPYDSYGGIHHTDEHLTQISKRRGGCGLDVSTLRPENSITLNSSRTSSGPISFMGRYSYSIREVGQDGRRGALMIMMNVHHPNIGEFITCKHDLESITGANISVKLTDEFLKAVKAGEVYTQRFPIDDPDSKYTVEIDARKVWRAIIKNAWEHAEPGIVFWDNILRESLADCYKDEGFETICTNPCCFAKSQDVYVVTKGGLKEIKSVTNTDKVWIDELQQWVATDGYFDAGTSRVYNVEFSNGDSLRITSNHKLMKYIQKRNGYSAELYELKDLSIGDKILCNTNDIGVEAFGNEGTHDEGMILGWLASDGCLSYSKDNDKYPAVILDFWEKDYEAADNIQKIFERLNYNNTLFSHSHNKVKRLRSTKFAEYFTNQYQTNIWQFRSKKHRIELLDRMSFEFISGFLRTYFSGDGTVTCNHKTKHYAIQCASINLELLKQIQKLLMLLGIKSGISLMRKAGVQDFGEGGIYETKDCYRLTITGNDNIKSFNFYIGFIVGYKQDKLNQICNIDFAKNSKCSKYTNIVNITELADKEDVGCISVPTHHKFAANTIVSGNSELPLCAYDSCRLMLMNLFSYVIDPFTKEAEFDFWCFYNHVKTAQRLMDDVVDLELEAIHRIIKKIQDDPEPEEIKLVESNMWANIRDKCIRGRRTGLGTTGLADVFAALGLSYGSKRSINLTNNIFKVLKFGSYQSSVDMAEEIGPFPIWNWKKEKDNPFLLRIKNEACNIGTHEVDGYDLYHSIEEFGRRNIANLTNSPAGTVSLETQTSQAIEPVYELITHRRKKINPNDEGARIDFVDASGDRWMEFDVLHPNLKKWMEVTGKDDIKLSPWWGCCAKDIEANQRIQIQAAAQQHIDHSISSTINLPKNVNQKTVGEIYEKAWSAGLKGITVYREGCRDGVILSGTKKKNIELAERPRELRCDVHHTQIDGKRYFVLVGLWEDGRPYEVFAGKNGFMSNKVKSGKIIRQRKGYYKALFNETDIELSPITASSSEMEGAITRLTSTSLRHGADMHVVVQQLEKVGEEGAMHCFARGVARTLKKYIKDGTIEKGEVCPECNVENPVRQSGCIMCSSCGWSKCI
jgi:ribonucleotide reductase alpha subunit